MKNFLRNYESLIFLITQVLFNRIVKVHLAINTLLITNYTKITFLMGKERLFFVSQYQYIFDKAVERYHKNYP